jgi:hypothetical protein
MSKSGVVTREYHLMMVERKSREIAALRARRDRLREALGRIARNGKMSTASNADERLRECVTLISFMIDTAREAIVANYRKP